VANTVTRSLHDPGLANWFGGPLANAVALNRAAGATSNPDEAGGVTNKGWNRWAPVNAAAIGVHLLGSAGQLVGNKDRLAAQKGVGTMIVISALAGEQQRPANVLGGLLRRVAG